MLNLKNKNRSENKIVCGGYKKYNEFNLEKITCIGLYVYCYCCCEE